MNKKEDLEQQTMNKNYQEQMRKKILKTDD